MVALTRNNSQARRPARLGALVSSAALIALLPLLAGCATAAGSDAAAGAPASPTAAGEEKISVLYALTADAGTLVPEDGSTTQFTLTLNTTDAHTIWFSDRPAHIAGTMSTASFITDWAGFGFAADPPNVAIVLHDAANETDTLVAELTNPIFDDATDTFTASVTVQDKATDDAGNATFEQFGKEGDPSLPTSFDSVSLFINDVAGTVENGCIVAPHMTC
jgi:hypothetical protein